MIRTRLLAYLAMLSLLVAFANAALADPAISAAKPTPPSTPAAAGASTATPDGPQPAEPRGGLIEDTDAAWVWSGMVSFDDDDLHGGSGHAGGPGTYGTYTFHGTAVDVYGMTGPSIVIDHRARTLGKAHVKVDDKVVGVVTLTDTQPSYQTLMCHVANLAVGNHVLQVVAQEGWIVVDYINVTDSSVVVDPNAYHGPSVLPEGDYAIFPRHAPEKCLDAPDTVNMTVVQIYAPTKGRTQAWHITPLGKEHYRISPVSAPDQALSMLGPQDAAGGMFCGLYAYKGNPAQQWALAPTDSGYYQLLFVAATTACLDVKGASHADGTAVVAYPNNINNGSASFNQQFAFQRLK